MSGCSLIRQQRGFQDYDPSVPSPAVGHQPLLSQEAVEAKRKRSPTCARLLSAAPNRILVP